MNVQAVPFGHETSPIIEERWLARAPTTAPEAGALPSNCMDWAKTSGTGRTSATSRSHWCPETQSSRWNSPSIRPLLATIAYLSWLPHDTLRLASRIASTAHFHQAVSAWPEEQGSLESLRVCALPRQCPHTCHRRSGWRPATRLPL